jgi:hypothetical protein
MNIIKIVAGSLLVSIGLFLIIIYLNLFYIGYSFLDFVYFIIRRGIILFFLGGVFLIYKGMGRKI